MKAVVYKKYGTPEEFKLTDVQKPKPRDNEVLIKVKAASINSWDWDLLRGKPYIVRMWGLLKPKLQILGADVAGTIESVGKNVKQFKIGDAVFGDLCTSGWGGFAEYTCAPEHALTLKPDRLTFEQAAAYPQAGVMALQGIQDDIEIQPGNKVLINGAGGGVGTFAIQIAKLHGAEITGVDKSSKFELMRSLGANHVIDYTKEDFTNNGQHYDLILDVVAHHRIRAYKNCLSPNGTFKMVGGSSKRLIQLILLMPWYYLFNKLTNKKKRKKLGILAHEPNKNLTTLLKFYEDGSVQPVIDSCYSLEDVPKAFHYFGKGLVKGKVIIAIN